MQGRRCTDATNDRSATCCKCVQAVSAATSISRQIRMTLGYARLSARSVRLALSPSLVAAEQTAAGRYPGDPRASVAPWKETRHERNASSLPGAALLRPRPLGLSPAGRGRSTLKGGANAEDREPSPLLAIVRSFSMWELAVFLTGRCGLAH